MIFIILQRVIHIQQQHLQPQQQRQPRRLQLRLQRQLQLRLVLLPAPQPQHRLRHLQRPQCLKKSSCGLLLKHLPLYYVGKQFLGQNMGEKI